MTAPTWINAIIADFGRSAGLRGLALNERGAAALRFENGATLRLEYGNDELVVAISTPAADVRRLLALAHPKARFGFRIRAGVLPKTGEAVMAIRFPERDATLPNLNSAFSVLWRLAGEIGGASWA